MPDTSQFDAEPKQSRRERRDAALAGSADPVLDFEYIKADLGISHATFHRGPRRELPVIQISDRRLGVRRSDYEAWKASRVVMARAA